MTDKVVIITSTSSSNQTFTVPADYGTITAIEVVASGGGGGSPGGGFGCTGGAGGGYSKITAISISPNDVLTYHLDVGGAANTAGPDAWFNGASLAASSVGAKGGGAGNSSGAGGGQGTTTGAVGTTKYAGGNGGGVVGSAGGGGGGSAGPHGTGWNGGNSGTSGIGQAIGGGGGGSDNSSGSAGTNGGTGNGGNGPNGTGGGAGSNSGNGTAGTAQTGGGGGGAGQKGGDGGSGPVTWTATLGPTAGPGGGAGGSSTNNNGANGGLYGGGGSGADILGTTGGSGVQGVIIFTYTPAAVGNSKTISMTSRESFSLIAGTQHPRSVTATFAQKLTSTHVEIGVLNFINMTSQQSLKFIKQAVKPFFLTNAELLTRSIVGLKILIPKAGFFVTVGQAKTKVLVILQRALQLITETPTNTRSVTKVIPIDTAYGSSNVVRFFQNQIFNPIYVNDPASVIVATSILFSDITPEGAPIMTNQNLSITFTRPDGSTITRVFPDAYIGEIDLPSPLGFYYGGSYAITPFAAGELNQAGNWGVTLAFANFHSPQASFLVRLQ